MPETYRLQDELNPTEILIIIFEYGKKGIETKGLKIGRYESSFIADLVYFHL